MHPVIEKSFGGLSRAYYVRQFLFGLVFPAFTAVVASRGAEGMPWPVLPWMAANTVLYPYARFSYESTVAYIVGDNLFIVNAGVMLFVKFLTMCLCWGLALVIAPLALVYLYVRNSRGEGA